MPVKAKWVLLGSETTVKNEQTPQPGVIMHQSIIAMTQRINCDES